MEKLIILFSADVQESTKTVANLPTNDGFLSKFRIRERTKLWWIMISTSYMQLFGLITTGNTNGNGTR